MSPSQNTFSSTATKLDVISSPEKLLSLHPNPVYVFWGIELFKEFGAAAAADVERSRKRAIDSLMMS